MEAGQRCSSLLQSEIEQSELHRRDQHVPKQATNQMLVAHGFWVKSWARQEETRGRKWDASGPDRLKLAVVGRPEVPNRVLLRLP
jgi:hypothetical protein